MGKPLLCLPKRIEESRVKLLKLFLIYTLERENDG